jgi:hypothetical protein
MLSLFYPGAQLIRTARTKKGGMTASFFTPEEYAKRASTYFEKNGFWEKEVARRTERWANILQAFSTYESRHDSKDPKPFARGINSYQLFFDGKRWWILTIYWLEETPGQPIPMGYLPASDLPGP